MNTNQMSINIRPIIGRIFSCQTISASKAAQRTPQRCLAAHARRATKCHAEVAFDVPNVIDCGFQCIHSLPCYLDGGKALHD